MIKWRQVIRIVFSWCCLIGCAAYAAGEGALLMPTPREFSELLGDKMPGGIGKITWLAKNVPQTNLVIYNVLPVTFSTNDLARLAEHFGVHGPIQRLAADMPEAPGYWIREFRTTNYHVWSSVYYNEQTGQFGYNSGEDNHRWDVHTHQPTAVGIPDEKEAMTRILQLLPLFGLSTNDLERRSDGSLKIASDTEGTTYNDRYDERKQKRYIRQINISVWQKLHDGASIVSIGGGGIFRAGFMSEGKLAELKLFFRKVRPVGYATPKTESELLALLRKGEGRMFTPHVPTELTVTNCSLIYGQGNSRVVQRHLWPAYAIEGFAVEDGETNQFRIYEPLKSR